jgi:hypothetical protein
MSGDPMGVDVRNPIGVLFTVLGLLLLGYGAMSWGDPGTTPTGIPIVPVWGGVMLAFGIVMLVIGRLR